MLDFIKSEIESNDKQCRIELDLAHKSRGKENLTHIINYNYLMGRKLAFIQIKNYLERKEKNNGNQN